MAVPVLQSPGDVLLLDSEKFDIEEQNKVWKSFGAVWLVVALSLLLSLVAGVCIWALVSNPLFCSLFLFLSLLL